MYILKVTLFFLLCIYGLPDLLPIDYILILTTNTSFTKYFCLLQPFFLFGLILLFHGKTSWNISLEKTNFAAECFYEYFVALFWSIQSQLPTLTANKNFSAYLDHSLSGSDCDCFNEADLDFCSVKSWAWKSTLGSEKTWTTSLAIINNYCRRDQRLTLPILDLPNGRYS